MSGKFPLMIFGLPGAALAIYKTAKPEKRKAVSGLLLSAALTSMITGITEPIEFTFLFVAPILYGIHCVLAGLAYMLMHLFNVGVGMTFSGGLIDMFLFGIMQGNRKTNWIWIVVVGIVYFIVYYFLFTLLIKKMDLKTPGRDDSDEVKLYNRSDVEGKKGKNDSQRDKSAKEEITDKISQMICNGLGGKKNISDVDCCATRLRCTVFESQLVNDDILKASGASGVIHKGNGVQIIYGPKVTVIKSNLEDYLETAENIEYVGENFENSNGNNKHDRINASENNSGSLENQNNEDKIGKFALDTKIIYSPVTGVAKDLSEVNDEAFASRMMGDGVAVTPTDSVIKAPADGEISFVFDTKHAIGFTTDDGVSLIIHVGIDTVKLQGKGFEILKQQGEKVKKGEPIMKIDIDYLKKNAPSLDTPVMCTELKDNEKIRVIKVGEVKAGEELFAIDIYK